MDDISALWTPINLPFASLEPCGLAGRFAYNEPYIWGYFFYAQRGWVNFWVKKCIPKTHFLKIFTSFLGSIYKLTLIFPLNITINVKMELSPRPTGRGNNFRLWKNGWNNIEFRDNIRTNSINDESVIKWFPNFSYSVISIRFWQLS